MDDYFLQIYTENKRYLGVIKIEEIRDTTLDFKVHSNKDFQKMKELADILAEKLNLDINISVNAL